MPLRQSSSNNVMMKRLSGSSSRMGEGLSAAMTMKMQKTLSHRKPDTSSDSDIASYQDENEFYETKFRIGKPYKLYSKPVVVIDEKEVDKLRSNVELTSHSRELMKKLKNRVG